MHETVIYLGLDGEMTGPDPARHRLIEIGLALSDGRCFSSRIGWNEFEYDPEALEAIGWTLDDVRSGSPLCDVDRRASEWVEGLTQADRIVPVGWGVSYFDRSFTDTALPALTNHLHHHCIELNCITYLCASALTYLGHRISADHWRRIAKKSAELRFKNEYGVDPTPHSAKHDALLAVYAWEWFCKYVQPSVPDRIAASKCHNAGCPGTPDLSPVPVS